MITLPQFVAFVLAVGVAGWALYRTSLALRDMAKRWADRLERWRM